MGQGCCNRARAAMCFCLGAEQVQKNRLSERGRESLRTVVPKVLLGFWDHCKYMWGWGQRQGRVSQSCLSNYITVDTQGLSHTPGWLGASALLGRPATPLWIFLHQGKALIHTGKCAFYHESGLLLAVGRPEEGAAGLPNPTGPLPPSILRYV